MTAFSGRRFSVYGSQSKAIEQACKTVGCTEPDAKGRCYRCGQLIERACTEKEHRFNGDEPTCACGTTSREEAHAQ